MMERELLLSRYRTPDGTLLTSENTHDYVSHVDSVTGETYVLDGGSEYVRMSVNDVPMTDESIYSDSDYEEIRKSVVRHAIGKDGKRKNILLKDMSDAHLWNCITYNVDNGFAVDNKMNITYMREIIYRHFNGISIEDDYNK